MTILIEFVPGDPATAILGDTATPEQLDQFRRKHGLDRPAFFFSFSRRRRARLRWHGMENRYVDYWRGSCAATWATLSAPTAPCAS